MVIYHVWMWLTFFNQKLIMKYDYLFSMYGCAGICSSDSNEKNFVFQDYYMENKIVIFHVQIMIEKFEPQPNLVNNNIMMILCFGKDNYLI